MKTVKLFNLDVGKTRPDPPFSDCPIGGLRVRLTDDYEAKIRRLAQPATRIIYEAEAKYLPQKKGAWRATATVWWTDCEEESVLLDTEGDDRGLWDLCNLLTFITGRSVVTDEYKDRYRSDICGDSHAAIPVETLPAAALAWQHRRTLVSKGLHIALILYNEAMNLNLLQARAALYSTALNIILDTHETTYTKVSKPLRKTLRNAIASVLSSFEKAGSLQPDQTNRYRKLLHSQIDRGPTAKDKLLSLLHSLKVVDLCPTSNQESRIQDVDQVRNRIVHTGVPKIEGLDIEQSKRYSARVSANVVPQIIRLVIGRALGFNSAGLGSYSQIKCDLVHFFSSDRYVGT